MPEFALDVIATVLQVFGAVDKVLKVSYVAGIAGVLLAAVGITALFRASRKVDEILDEPTTPPPADEPEGDDPAWGADFLDLAEAFEAVPRAEA